MKGFSEFYGTPYNAPAQNTLKDNMLIRSAKAIRKVREEWRKTLLEEIDFRERLFHRVRNDVVRKALLEQLDAAIEELSRSELYAMIEHEPDDPEIRKYLLPTWKQRRNKRDGFSGDEDQ